jgi:membrane protein
VLSFIAITILFTLLYKVVPDVHVEWQDVWIGAAVTSLLFTIGKFLIGLYLGKAGVGSAYGAAGSLVAFLVWVYYSAQVFFLGAEFTHVFAERHGSRAQAREEGAAQPSEVQQFPRPKLAS